MKQFKILLPTILLSLAALSGCQTQTETSSTTSKDTSSQNSDVELINDTIDNLRNGFTLEGTLTITKNYFADSYFQVPDNLLSSDEVVYSVTINYENSESYTGLDRRYYEVIEDEANNTTTKVYYYGENVYNLDGYAGLNYLDYNNQLVTGYAVDENNELVPYGTNGLLNPFTLIQREDFVKSDEGFTLSNLKTSILFTQLFAIVEDYQQNIVFETSTFNFHDGTLDKATIVSQNIDSNHTSTVPTEDDPYHQTYIRYNYEVDLTFSNIGTAISQDLIAVEPYKEENNPLRNALANMVEKQEVTVTRKIEPYINGVYSGEDNYLTSYYMGEDEGIYSQSYTLSEGQSAPTSPSLSDYILKKAIPNGNLRVYQLDDITNTFYLNPSNYSNIDNIYAYSDLKYDLSILSADIFNINEDGSYSPTEDNLPYITRDIFMSYLDTFNQVDQGYVNDVRIYVNDDETCIDHIDIKYADSNGYSGLMVISYSDLGDSKPSFDIVYA